MTAQRLRGLFEETRSAGRTALLPYLTAGLPDPGHSADLFVAMAEAGADAFEVGIPYSDPLMDGPTIQLGGAYALAAGTTLDRGLSIAGHVVARTQRPALIMTYSNVVFRVGPAEFARRVAAAGASGVIVADLPLEEAGPIQRAVEGAGLGMVLFVAPTTTDDRLANVIAAQPAFIYGVADMGVTGERTEASGRAAELAERVRERTDLPLVMGVGISTPQQAAALAPLVDGIIVGSALVRRVLEAASPGAAATALREAVSALTAALR